MAKKIIKKKIVKKIVKKVVRKAKLKTKKMSVKKIINKQKLVGKITHYYSDIKVVVIKLKDTLKVGDEIRITGGEDTDFNQKIESMQIEHIKVKMAKKGKLVGLKIKKKAREGYLVYKI